MGISLVKGQNGPLATSNVVVSVRSAAAVTSNAETSAAAADRTETTTFEVASGPFCPLTSDMPTATPCRPRPNPYRSGVSQTPEQCQYIQCRFDGIAEQPDLRRGRIVLSGIL